MANRSVGYSRNLTVIWQGPAHYAMHAVSSTQNLSVNSCMYAPAVSRTPLLQIKKRNRDPNRGRTAYLNPVAGAQNTAHFVNEHDPESGGSDDEDSYGSQDRRSDGGYHGRD